MKQLYKSSLNSQRDFSKRGPRSEWRSAAEARDDIS